MSRNLENKEDTKENIENTEDKGQETACADALKDFKDALGIHLTEQRAGYAKGEMEVKPWHMNVLGVLHGGCLFSLADTVSGCAIAGHGHRVTTVSSNINFLRPGRDTAKLVAVAEEVKYGKTFSVCDAKIFDDKERLLATTTMTFYHLYLKDI